LSKPSFKETILSIGLIIIRCVFKSFAENLINLYTLALPGAAVFANQASSRDQTWKLTRFFNVRDFHFFRISGDLKAEYCCFFHFLIGKRRSMTKRDEIEVG